MTLVSPTVPNAGDEANASDISTPINQLAAVINGAIDDSNISSVSGSKVAAGTINTSQLADGSITYEKLASSSGVCVQVKSTLSTAVATGTTAIPADDTIPQITEGDEYLTVSITPKSATNLLEVSAVLTCAVNTTTTVALALFRDATANALAAGGAFSATANGSIQLVLPVHTVTAGSTSATTFRLRAGPNSGTMTVNGASGARRYGGVTSSSLIVREYRA